MISIILWIMASNCWAIVWVLEHRPIGPIYGWFGSSSFLRAYKDNNPAAGPKFFGSTTMLNFTTNATSFFSTLGSWILAGSLSTFEESFWFFLPIPPIQWLWIVALLFIHRVVWWLVFKLVGIILIR